MTIRSRLRAIPIAAALACLLPAPALAQWDTPSRAFHKGTTFALDGRHVMVACAACHVNGVTRGTPSSCASCHWVRRQNDPYRTALGSQCESCHRTSSWSAVKWDHGVETALVLGGTHRTLTCIACHANRRFTGTSGACVTCHRADYDRTTTPNHAAAGYATTCDSCHRMSDSAWQGAAVNHNAFYPLLGVHATVTCTTCHTNNRYAGTPTTCVGCHRSTYDRTTSPNHAAAGYATTCDTCHRATDATWLSAAFNHGQFFPLVGLHATASCAACHASNVYRGTPRDCYTCHAAAYRATSNPNHLGAGFPTTCDTCHRDTDTSWSQGKFAHTAFPITSGKHAGNACSACHTTPSSYTVFTCLTCHGRTQMDSKHQGRTGYRYDSTACYGCHPTGRAD